MAKMRMLVPAPAFDSDLLPEIADVDVPVGRACENNVTDVQLVQLLLKEAIEFFRAAMLGPMVDSRGRPITWLVAKGICGAATREAIASFQRRVVVALSRTTRERALVADGIVSPTRGRAESTTDKALFTIVWLNQLHRQLVGAALRPDDVMIEPLRTALLASQGAAEFA